MTKVYKYDILIIVKELKQFNLIALQKREYKKDGIKKMKTYEIKKLLSNGKKQVLRTCASEREAITELEKIFTLTDIFYISETETL